MKFLALWVASFLSPSTPPQPRPDLNASQVVSLLVTALQNNNSPLPNAGVFTAYRFASPANHAVTGPYGHFFGLVKAPDYEALLHPHPLDVGTIAIKGDYAEQIVTVHPKPGKNAVFKFTLARQTGTFCHGCWMVDGVDKL
jgi:hypothetical protein